ACGWRPGLPFVMAVRSMLSICAARFAGQEAAERQPDDQRTRATAFPRARRTSASDPPLNLSEARKAQRFSGRAGEIPLPTDNVGRAVDHRRRQTAASVGEGDERAAGCRLVRHAELIAAEDTAAGKPEAVRPEHRRHAHPLLWLQ